MAITSTPRFGLPQWGSGQDSPSRQLFNSTFDRIDDRAAYDDGAVGGTSLPGTEVVDGRYAQTTDGNYRKLYRRAAGAWQQVGGNTWSETIYSRADGALATGAAARITSHPSLANPSATENWDGSSVRGGRQAIGDLNSGQPGAVHVGDTTSAVDLATRGRVYARTAAAGQRGFVASAHAADAGTLFAAREPGGSEPWSVDARGRMRSQAPVAFGGASLTDNVPVSIAPGASDISALDLAAAASKPALRVFRAVGDATPIALFEQNRIQLGRSSWSGGVLDLLGPTTHVGGTLNADGAVNVGGALDVDGATTLAGLTAGTTGLGSTTASSMQVSGDTTLSGRLRLPTGGSRPSGNASGQVRVGDDWALEVYDGSAWRGRFGGSSGRKHKWEQGGGTVGGGDVYTQVTGFPSGNGGGSIASFSSGGLLLNRAGLWTIMATAFIDSGADGLNRLKLNWADGAFPRGDDIIDIRTRQITVNQAASGNGEAVITWVGYVSAAEAARPIKMLVAQRSAGGASTTNTFFALMAEFLSS